MVFGGTALALASAGLYLALVHGVSAARLNRRGLRPLVGMGANGVPKWASWMVDLGFGTTLWYTNMAIENGPFEDVFPIENGDFPLLC